MLQRGHSGDGCVLASTLCKYDLRKGDLFVLTWARVRRVRRGSISSELLVCGGGVRSILLLPLVARCLETIDVCIWRMFVFMSVVVTVWGSVGMLVCSSFLISVCMFVVSKALLISSATVIVRVAVAIWLNPFATVLFTVCSSVTVECCVLYLCCVGVITV